jgi:hypothetical protein
MLSQFRAPECSHLVDRVDETTVGGKRRECALAAETGRATEPGLPLIADSLPTSLRCISRAPYLEHIHVNSCSLTQFNINVCKVTQPKHVIQLE